MKPQRIPYYLIWYIFLLVLVYFRNEIRPMYYIALIIKICAWQIQLLSTIDGVKYESNSIHLERFKNGKWPSWISKYLQQGRGNRLATGLRFRSRQGIELRRTCNLSTALSMTSLGQITENVSFWDLRLDITIPSLIGLEVLPIRKEENLSFAAVGQHRCKVNRRRWWWGVKHLIKLITRILR